jgi:hypothetical protein
MKAYRRNGSIAPLILYLGKRGRLVVCPATLTHKEPPPIPFE